MTQTVGSGGAPAQTAEKELTHKEPPGTKAGTVNPKAKTVKMGTETTNETPKTTEERIIHLETRLTDAVAVINNLIAFCNTIERWRTLPFKTDEQVQAEQEGKKEEHTEESTQTTSE